MRKSGFPAAIPTAIIVTCAGVLSVLSSIPMHAADDPLMGSWKLNPAKSSFYAGRPPKAWTNRYSPSGPNGLSCQSDRTSARGETAHIEFNASFDGSDFPLRGDPSRDAVSVKRVNAYAYIANYKKAGEIVQRHYWVVSKDGKTLMISATGMSPDGELTHNLIVFDKQ